MIGSFIFFIIALQKAKIAYFSIALKKRQWLIFLFYHSSKKVILAFLDTFRTVIWLPTGYRVLLVSVSESDS